MTCKHITRSRPVYLNVVGEPVELGIRVFHGEEHVASGYNGPLWDGFDPDGKTPIVFLRRLQAQ